MILFFMLLLFSNDSIANSNLFPEKGLYVEALYPKKGWLGVQIKNADKKIEIRMKVNLSTYESSEVNKEDFDKEFSKVTFSPAPKVDYKLENCIKYDLGYLSPDFTCGALSVDINGEKYLFQKDHQSNYFYTWEEFVDPVLWGDYLLFKQKLPRHREDPEGPWIEASYNGWAILDLKQKKRIQEYVSYYSTAVTSLIRDDENSLLWVGNMYGIYGRNNQLKEVVSCGFLKNFKKLKITKFTFICSKGDYLYDEKYRQRENLIEKTENLKKGIAPPEDFSKRMFIRGIKEVNEDRKKAGLSPLPVDE